MAAAKPRVKPPSPGLPITYGVVHDEQTARGRRSLRADSRPLKKSELVAVDLVRTSARLAFRWATGCPTRRPC